MCVRISVHRFAVRATKLLREANRTMFDRQPLHFPVDLKSKDASASFAGFYYPAQGAERNILQVLVHGNSYDHRYWDAGVINGRSYSYIDYMTARGFAILAVDLPGVGASSKPNGYDLSLENIGRALSNLIKELQGPQSALERSFNHITSVGHSMGSSVGVFAEGNWPAADSLIVTATGYFKGRATSGWPAGAREKLLESDYALVPPELRTAFYYEPSADPDVIAYDNLTLRTSAPSGLWSDCITLRDDPRNGAADISCPVYIQLGEHDPIMLGEYADQERLSYSSAPRVVIEAIPDIGHSFNLHLKRESSWQGICRFFD